MMKLITTYGNSSLQSFKKNEEHIQEKMIMIVSPEQKEKILSSPAKDQKIIGA